MFYFTIFNYNKKKFELIINISKIKKKFELIINISKIKYV